MKKIFKCLVLLFSVCILGGCGKEECECPTDLNNNNISEEQSVVISDYSELYKKTAPSVVKVKVQSSKDRSNPISTGSGVVAFEEGKYAYIYTNAHVVRAYTTSYEIEIVFSSEKGEPSGESEIATLVGKDEKEDVAILRINKSDKYEIATLGDSDNLEKGDWVYTIGSPYNNFNYTTAGNISNNRLAVNLDATKTGVDTIVYAIMFDADINHGNSGGALFDKDGKLIGITSFVYEKYTLDGKTEVAYGMYGALPIKYFDKVAKYLMINSSAYVRANLNLDLISINEMGIEKDKYKISSEIKTGVYIKTSYEEKLTHQSIIREINGKSVKSVDDFMSELLKYNVGDTVTLTIIDKDGLNNKTVSITLHS